MMMLRHTSYLSGGKSRGAARLDRPASALCHRAEFGIPSKTVLILDRDSLHGSIGPHLNAQLHDHVLNAIDAHRQGPAATDLAHQGIDLSDAEAGRALPVHILDAAHQRGEFILLRSFLLRSGCCLRRGLGTIAIRGSYDRKLWTGREVKGGVSW
jgi:hypothetical protein